MLTFNQSYLPSAKAHLDSQFALLSEMSNQLFSTARRLNELNVQVVQTVMQESLTSLRDALGAQNPYEAISIVAGQMQPAAEKMRAYQQHLTNIAAQMQVDLSKAAEKHVPENSRTAAAVADEVARRASEETQKATQRQKAALDKLTTPLGKPEGGKGNIIANVH